MELVEQSVADHLSDFEAGFAWNRIFEVHDDVVSLGVDTIDGYQRLGSVTGTALGAFFYVSSWRLVSESVSAVARTETI